jgi:cob(I)alamin adenosyltransferase
LGYHWLMASQAFLDVSLPSNVADEEADLHVCESVTRDTERRVFNVRRECV